MTESDNVEFAFVEATLKKFGFRLQKIFISETKRLKLKESGHLQEGPKVEVLKSGMVGGELRFIFPDYGRFIEINYHKGTSNANSAFSGKNKTAFQKKKDKFKSKSNHRKDTRWYARNAYGYLNSLIGELMYGFTERFRLQFALQ